MRLSREGVPSVAVADDLVEIRLEIDVIEPLLEELTQAGPRQEVQRALGARGAEQNARVRVEAVELKELAAAEADEEDRTDGFPVVGVLYGPPLEVRVDDAASTTRA